MRRDLPVVGYYPSDVSQYQGLFSNCCGQRMVPPRLNVGATKYWLRARSGTRNGGKIIVSVDSLYNIFKESRVSNKRTETSSVSQNVPASPDIPALRKSARLLEKRAALLRCTRGGQYWQRTRSKGNKRSLLVSVKSLYTSGRCSAVRGILFELLMGLRKCVAFYHVMKFMRIQLYEEIDSYESQVFPQFARPTSFICLLRKLFHPQYIEARGLPSEAVDDNYQNLCNNVREEARLTSNIDSVLCTLHTCSI